MVDEVVVEAVWRRLSRGFLCVEEANRGADVTQAVGVYTDAYARGTAIRDAALARMQEDDVYGASSVEAAMALYTADRNFLRTALTQGARVLGTEALDQMRSIRRSIWNRYLHDAGSRTAPTAADTLGPGLLGLARSLSCWLVFTTDSPFPALLEDESAWRNSTFGLPDPPPLVPLPGGPGGTPEPVVHADDVLDAGTPRLPDAPEPRVGEEGGPNLPTRWSTWEINSRRAPNQEYARYMLALTDSQEIQRRLLAPESGGHPILALVGRFRAPWEIYQLLRLPEAERTPALRVLVREIEQYLVRGENEFERSLTENDWETLRPMLEAAKWVLFPEGPPPGTANTRGLQRPLHAPLHRLCDQIIDDDLIGWTLRDTAFAITLVVSLGLTLATLGTTGPVAMSALGAFAVAIDVTSAVIDVALMVAENEERALANRYATIDQALRLAQEPEDVTLTVALNVMALLLPVAVSRVARRTARPSLLARALADVPEEAVPRVAADASSSVASGTERRAAARAERAATRDSAAAERGVAESGTGERAASERATAERGSSESATGDRGTGPGSGTTDDVAEAIDRSTLRDDEVVWEPLPASGVTHAGARLAREQEDIMLNLLGRNWNDVNPWTPSATLSATRRAALARADATARSLLSQIRAHWDAALARGAASLDAEARAVFARIPSDLPESAVNDWVRRRLFNPHRQRAMRRIWNDTALREALAEAGVVIHWRRGSRGATVGSFRIRGRGLSGEIEHIFLDVDHGVIGHAEAVREARASGSWEPLVTTVDSTNMQLLTGRENRIVIEELRGQIRTMWGVGSIGSPATGSAVVDDAIEALE